jgi:hypothetical protein
MGRGSETDLAVVPHAGDSSRDIGVVFEDVGSRAMGVDKRRKGVTQLVRA